LVNVSKGQEVLLEHATQGARACLMPGALGRLGDVDVARDAPLGAVWRPAGGTGTRQHSLPVAAQCGHRHDVDAHRDPAPLAGQYQRLGVGRQARHGDGRVWLLVRRHVHTHSPVGALRQPEAPAGGLGCQCRAVAAVGGVPDRQDQIDHVTGDLAVLASGHVDFEQVEVAGKPAGADTEVEAAASHLVELRNPGARTTGLWLGRQATPVPSRIWRVWMRAAARSDPGPGCSPSSW
jgi:hypothetical protein